MDRRCLAFKTEAHTQDIGWKIDWARDRGNTIATEDVISFLSRKAVVPKYGFPVDVVELDLHRRKGGANREALDVTLERDLAIAVGEFAPESEVVANKKIWTSCGLKRVAAKEWPRRAYSQCGMHGFLVRRALGHLRLAQVWSDNFGRSRPRLPQEAVETDPLPLV